MENKGRVGEAVIWALVALVHGAGLTGWEARLGCVRVYTCACVRVTMFRVTIMMFKLHAQLERNMSITSMAYWNIVRVKVGTLLVDVYEAWLHALLTLEGLAQVSKTMEDDHFDLDQVSAATGQLH